MPLVRIIENPMGQTRGYQRDEEFEANNRAWHFVALLKNEEGNVIAVWPPQWSL